MFLAVLDSQLQLKELPSLLSIEEVQSFEKSRKTC